MNKHTPGPWRSRVLKSPKKDDNHPVFSVEAGTFSLPVAQTVSRVFSKGECEANATLISAAPELLAFAQYYMDSESLTTECDRMAKAAIAKAEGRS